MTEPQQPDTSKFAELMSMYSKQVPGGTWMDMAALAIDFISAAKVYAQMQGFDKAYVMKGLAETWDNVEITVNIPSAAKQ